MDLSNRPGFSCDLNWQAMEEEMANDVSVEILGT